MNAKELIERTKAFSVAAIQLTENLPNNYVGNHIKGQLIRCSTSVAANYRAARLSQTRATFIAKLSIVIEEADEVAFWVDLAVELGLWEASAVKQVLDEARELTAIFIATRKTMKKQSG